MLDLTSIAVVDNHCHAVLLEQKMDGPTFRSHVARSNDADFVEKHMPNSVSYLWTLRQLATFLGCRSKSDEEEVLRARNRLESKTLIEHLYRAAKIDTFLLDGAEATSAASYAPEHMGQLGHCRFARILSLEQGIQTLLATTRQFDEAMARYTNELTNLRERGYVGIKSTMTRRDGLAIEQWNQDQAAASFQEVRQARAQARPIIIPKPLLDYLLHIAFLQASEQDLPIQIEMSYGSQGAGAQAGDLLQLRSILEQRDYRQMRVVLLHGSYPDLRAGAYLAATYAQVYLDLSYASPFIERQEMLAFTRRALGTAPASKLLYSSDGTAIPEMHWIAAVRGRSILGQVFDEMVEADEIDEEQAFFLAQQILHDTAYTVYKL